MSAELYLDTARLGRMCSSARRAEQAFAKLASQFGSTLYLERFLAYGFRALPRCYRHKVPALRCWRGISGLKQGLGRFVHQPENLSTLLFGQSKPLIQFAGDCLFRQAKRVLVTDLAWPTYVRALHRRARRHGATIQVVSLSDLIFRDHATADDVAQRLVEAYRTHGCDGLFITDITNHGVRLPIESVIRILRTQYQSFVAVDGAQALNHRPVDLASIDCDLYLAGTHKWLGSYHPLRVVLFGRSTATSADVASSHSRQLLNDPLAEFCESLEHRQHVSLGETVNVLPLITAAAALRHTEKSDLSACWLNRVTNGQSLCRWLEEVVPTQHIDPSLRSAVVLVPTESFAGDHASYRRRLLEHGIAASVLPSGWLRLAMPSFVLSWQLMSTIAKGLHHISAPPFPNQRPSSTSVRWSTDQFNAST